MTFGKRKMPCGDCDADGYCTMNCGPRIAHEAEYMPTLDEAIRFIKSNPQTTAQVLEQIKAPVTPDKGAA